MTTASHGQPLVVLQHRRRASLPWLAISVVALLPSVAQAQATISSGSGYSITFNGNQQAFFSNTWDGTSQQSPSNIALSSQGSTAFASSQLGGATVHFTVQANDGIYGNNRSWLSNLSGTQAYVGIAFPTSQSLSSIAWGRDNGRNDTATPTGGGDSVGGASGQFTDRVAGPYTIQFTTAANPNASTPDSSWTTLGTVSLADSGSFLSYYRHEFNVATSGGAPIAGVTGIRFLVSPQVILDEIEVYRTSYWTGGSAVWSSTTAWQTAASVGTSTTPFAGDSLAFAQATAATQAVTLGAADRTTRALSFTTTDAVNLTAGGTNRTLTLGWAGDLTTSSTAAISTLSIGSSAGPVTIGSASAGDQVAVALNASQAWTNDSTNAVTVLNGISRVSSDTTSRVLTITGSGNTAIGGIISNGGSAGTLALTKSGAGTLTLSASSAYTGLTTVTAGSLALNGAGSLLTTGSIVLAGSGATFDISAASGGGTVGMLTGTAGSIVALGDRTLTVGDATSGTFAGGFGGTGGLTKLGSGLLALSGSSSYSGTTSIDAGTLRMANANALGTGTISFAGGTLQYSGITTDVSGRLSTAASQPYNVDTNGNAVTWATALTSSGGTLTKGGAGTLTLSASNSYTGATTVTAGTLALSSAGNLPTTGTVALTGAGATFDISGASGSRTIGMLTGTVGTVALGGLTLGVGDATSGTFGGVINGTGGFWKNGSGRLTLTAANGYTGVTTVSAGTLALSGSGSLATNGIVVLNSSGATFDISGATNDITIGTLTGSAGSSIAIGGRTLTVNQATDLVFDGVISGSGGITLGGPSNLRLTGSNTYTGPTVVNAGILVLQGAANRLSPSTVVSLNGGTIDISDKVQTWAGLSGNAGANIYSYQTTTGSLVLNVASGTSYTYAGALGTNSYLGYSVVKNGAGTQILTGSNAYTQGTTLNSGTLGFARNALGSTGTVSLNGGTLRWESGNTQDISSRLVISSGSAATIDVGTNDVTFANAFGAGSTGSLTKIGAGRLTVTGTAGYIGGTTIASGTLQIGNGSTAGAITGDVVNNSVLVLNRSDTVVLPGTVSGSGAVIQAGPGTIVFGGSSSFTGGMSVSAGAVTARNASALGSGTVTVAADGRLNVNAMGSAVNNDLALGGGTVSSFIATAATGGTYSTTPDGLYGLNTFTSGADTFGGYLGTVDVLVVGGGGGGGSRFGGGGGAGGVVYQQGVAVGSTVAVTVGGGGSGGAATGGAGTLGANPGTNGQNSVFGSLVAFGGGGGAAGDTGNGLAGGSGGGAAGRFAGNGGSGTSSQGFSGGSSTGASPYVGGGGGGAGGAGSVSGTNGAGGIGRLLSITGSDVYYGGGGGGGGSGDGSRAGGTGGLGGGGTGGNYTGTPAATAGTANTGGGGGGGAYLSSGSNQAGAAGGSGVVIVRYALSSLVNDIQTLSGNVTVNATATLDAVRGSGGLRFTGAMSGAGGLTIASSGSGAQARVILDGAAKSYSGPTVINAGGDLRVNSDNSLATGAVTVNGRLGGSGSLGGAVTVNSGGILAPGNSIESLTTGDLSFAGGSTYDYEINSSVPLSVGADFTKALGALSLSGSVALSLVDLAASPVALNPGTTFSLFNYTGSWNGGLLSVSGSPVADNGTFTAGLNTWRLNYAATTGGSNYSSEYTTGNFVNIIVVPEPGAIGLAVVGIAAALALRRRT